MSTPNYYVKGTSFWYGQIRLTNDPEKLGRVKVRILGIHTPNSAALPDEDLPWAYVQQSPNGWANVTPMLPKTWVVGYFADGMMGQQPIITGVLPRIFGLPEDFVTNGDSSEQKAELTAKTNRNDMLRWGAPGSTSISRAGTGDVANTVIAKTNANLSHMCDFRYFVNIPNLNIGLGEFQDPVKAIQSAIRSGKNKAAQITSLLLTQISTKLRAVIDTIVSSLGMDASGQLSKTYTVAKDIFRQINYYTKQAAMIAETASMYYNLVKDIQVVVNYLKSLPQRLQAMLQGCLAQFMGSVNSFVNQLKSMPGVVTNQVSTILNELGVSTQSNITSAKTAATKQAASAPSNMVNAISTATVVSDANHATILTDYINSSANAKTVLASAQSNTYDPTKLQAP